jgi:DNA-directed RNA polymerase specialized sigma24 family protein
MEGREKQRIEHLLDDWGRWVKQGRTWPNTLGYPRQTMEARVMSNEIGSRSMPSRSKVPRRTIWDERITKVDQICNRMPPDLRTVVKARYVERLSVRDIAVCSHQSKNTIEKSCAEAIAWVGGAMA